MPNMDEALRTKIHKLISPTEVQGIELIQDLWGGYGKLLKVRGHNRSLIVKLISYPEVKNHPRGWNSDLGHQRKIKSYQVETTWYQKFRDPSCRAKTAQLIDAGKVDQEHYLILEDLNVYGYQTTIFTNDDFVMKALTWLAEFHRHYLNNKPTELWEVGTYWHLETRPDEWEALKEGELKEAASKIDEKLNQAKYKTLVHGDAKLANFLFSDEAAAVDFQYVGGGVGIKDVAYFLSSVYEEGELEKWAPMCLDHYFRVLNLPEVEKEWRALYPVAWCDFYRFLLGWSPGHWKINDYSERMKDEALKCL